LSIEIIKLFIDCYNSKMNSCHFSLSVIILLFNKTKEFFFLFTLHLLCYFDPICLFNIIKHFGVSIKILLKVLFSLFLNRKLELISSFFN